MAGFNFQPYVQPYVAPPIEEFDNMGRILNERYEQNVATMDETEILFNQIKTLEGVGSEIKRQALTDVQNSLDAIRKEGKIENASNKIREVVRRVSTNQNLQQAAENYKKAQEEENFIREIERQGGRAILFKDFRNESLDDQGNLRALEFGTEKELDPSAQYQQLFDQIQAESSTSQVGDWGQGGRGIYESFSSSSQVQQITEQRIRDAAEANIDRIISSTDEGNQRYRVLTQLQGMSHEDARNQMLNEAIGVGRERVFKNTATSSARSAIGDPYLDDAYKRAQMANMAAKASATGVSDQGNEYRAIANLTSLEPNKARSNVSKPLFGDKGIKELVSAAFVGEPEKRSLSKSLLYDSLTSLLSHDNEKVAKSSLDYLTFFNKVTAKYGEENADLILSKLVTVQSPGSNIGKSSQVIPQSISKQTGIPIEEVNALRKEAYKLAQNNTGRFFDTAFEDEISKTLNSPSTFQHSYLSPKMVGENSISATEAAQWERASKAYSWEAFDLISAPEGVDLKKLKGNPAIKSASFLPAGNGRSTPVMLEDDKGNLYQATFKDQQAGDDFLSSFAYLVGGGQDNHSSAKRAESEILYKSQFKFPLLKGSQKLSDFAQYNEIAPAIDVEGFAIHKEGEGYHLSKDNKKITIPRVLAGQIGGDVSRDQLKQYIKQNLSQVLPLAVESGVISPSVISPSGELVHSPDAIADAISVSTKPAIYSSQYDILKNFFPNYKAR